MWLGVSELIPAISNEANFFFRKRGNSQALRERGVCELEPLLERLPRDHDRGEAHPHELL